MVDLEGACAKLLAVRIIVSCLPDSVSIDYCTHCIAMVDGGSVCAQELYLELYPCARICTHEHIGLFTPIQEVLFGVSISNGLTSVYFGLESKIN